MHTAIPEGLKAYKRTPEFSHDFIPAGLLHDHSTKAGVWAKIVILEGQLRYTIQSSSPEVIDLNPTLPGIIEPQITHHVKPLEPVRFYVEFYR